MLIKGAKQLATLSPAIQAASSLKISEQYKYNGEALLPDFGIAPGVNFENLKGLRVLHGWLMVMVRFT